MQPFCPLVSSDKPVLLHLSKCLCPMEKLPLQGERCWNFPELTQGPRALNPAPLQMDIPALLLPDLQPLPRSPFQPSLPSSYFDSLLWFVWWEPRTRKLKAAASPRMTSCCCRTQNWTIWGPGRPSKKGSLRVGMAPLLVWQMGWNWQSGFFLGLFVHWVCIINFVINKGNFCNE